MIKLELTVSEHEWSASTDGANLIIGRVTEETKFLLLSLLPPSPPRDALLKPQRGSNLNLMTVSPRNPYQIPNMTNQCPSFLRSGFHNQDGRPSN
jgi:hypothetical protein